MPGYTRPGRVCSLYWLRKLHLVADQNDVPCAYAHGENICEAYLPGLVDKEIVESLIEFRPREEPGGACNQLVATARRSIVVERVDNAGTAQELMLEAGSLDAGKGHASVTRDGFHLFEQLIYCLVGVRGHTNSLSVGQHRDNGMRRGVFPAPGGP